LSAAGTRDACRLLVHHRLDGFDAIEPGVGASVLLKTDMKKICHWLIVAALLTPIASLAAQRTVVLSIPTMDCATCPITIRLALLKMKGVSSAKVSYKQREARVTFDDASTNVDALRATTAGVGYPSLMK
jgi:mercuric ion binding protein